ncbi:hypothetical protein PQX77_001290 [Marasmius sp. AFHP31]|nr:hypothetical protein PQX77_001290 [Marasmius sp. AFHP31]
MCYFEDNPLEKTWILEIGTPIMCLSLPAEYSGVDVASHSEFTLSGIQGPLVATAFQTFPPEVQLKYDSLDAREMDMLCRLLFKMETRHSARKKTEVNRDMSSQAPHNSESSANPSSIVPDPELSQLISSRIQQPSKPPCPVIGKLPKGHKRPKDQVVGAQPKDESCNYKYKSPIETDAAIDKLDWWVLSLSLSPIY